MPIYGTAPTAVWTFDGTDYSDITYDVQRIDLQSVPILTDDCHPEVTISGGGGSGAKFTANVKSGQVVSFNLIEKGSGYTSEPDVEIDLSCMGTEPTRATATAMRGTGDEEDKVIAITVDEDGGGSGYSTYLYVGFERRFDAMMVWLNSTAQYANLIWEFSEKDSGWKRFVPSQILPFDFQTSRSEAVGSIARGEAEVGVVGEDSNGNDIIGIIRINVLEGGSGYGGSPTVTITSMNHTGTKATATVMLDGGRIEEINVGNHGSGYDISNPPTITISGQNVGNFNAHDYMRWDANHPAFDAWRKVAITDIDGVRRYWARISGTPIRGNSTRLTALTIRPFASIATAEDVREQLQFREKFPDDAEFDANMQYNFPDNSNGQTFPLTEKIVERYIRGAEDSIYFITGQYYRPEFQEYELLDFRAYGMALRHRPVLHVYDLAVHNGNDWETKEEGKNHDWHMEYELGMIYISTLFMDVVPPILRRGYSERRNQGSFKRGVRVSYVHGHDTTDRMAMEVNRIVTKQACIDIISNNDFAWLMPQSLDRVSLERKVQLWREEIEEFKSRYAKLFLF